MSWKYTFAIEIIKNLYLDIGQYCSTLRHCRIKIENLETPIS